MAQPHNSPSHHPQLQPCLSTHLMGEGLFRARAWSGSIMLPVQDEEWAAVHHPNSLTRQGWDEPGLPPPPRLSARGRWWRTILCKCMTWLMLCTTSETGHQSPPGWQTGRDGEELSYQIRGDYPALTFIDISETFDRGNSEVCWIVQR